MKELRCLVFTGQEVIKAVLDRRRRMREPLPTGTVDKIVHHQAEGIQTILKVVSDDGDIQDLILPEPEVAAAMVAYCMGRRIPLPVESDKTLSLINGALTLMITMNFNKPPRLVGPLTGAAGAVRRKPAG